MGVFGFIYKYDFFEFLIDFEVKKRIIYFNFVEKVIFKVLISLLEIYCEMNLRCNIKIVIMLNFKYENKLIWIGDKLWMDVELIKVFFDESCKKLVDYLK